MTDNDNHKLSDEQLADYLAGKDTVSGAHRELEDVSSPSHLDERILARARESVAGQKPTRNDVFIRPYATAATVFLCLTISFLYLNNSDVPGTGALRSPEDTTARLVEGALEEQAPAAPGAESAARSRVASEADTQRAVASTSNIIATGADSNATANEATADQDASLDQLLDLVEERQLSQSEQQGITFAARLQVAEPELSYRENREDWLEEIARLRETGEIDSAAEEAVLFLEAYPETDLEAALRALESP